VQRLGAVEGRRVGLAVRLGRPTHRSAEPTSGLPASSFLQRLSNGHMMACLGALVQIRPKTCSNEFSRIFQPKILFLKFLIKNKNLARKILEWRCKDGKIQICTGKN
jgi:hypothetical protein